MPALADDRYKSVINGHVTAEGKGTTPAALTLTAGGTLNDSSILGGTISQLSFTADVAGDTAHVTASGEFAEFDPAAATGRPAMKGEVAGALDVDGTAGRTFRGGVTA